MTQRDLIRILGDMITDVDVLRCEFSRESETRIQLDNLRDDLDRYQQRFVRGLINVNTPMFDELSSVITEINNQLIQSIHEITEVADTLENLVRFVGVIQKIAELVP